MLGLTENPDELSYYTQADYPDVPKADVHVHVRAERTTFVEKAKQDQFKLVNIVVDGASSWQGIEDQFEYAVLQQKAFPGQYKVITSFSVEGFHQANWLEKTQNWLDQCFDRGAIGIKVWKNIGMVLQDADSSNVMLDDARFDGIFTKLEESGKIVVGHLGEPLNCWLPLDEMTTNNDRSYFKNNPQYHMYLHPELPSYEDQMEARNNRLDKHPDLQFMGAHMASIEWSVDSLAAWFDRYPKATVDLAARMGQVFWQTQQDREKVRDFFIKYQDRLLYATDMGDNGSPDPADLTKRLEETWKRDWQYFVSGEEMESDLVNGSFRGIQLPQAVVDKIYFQNARRVFDL
ncbi:MAG: amidohydrolase family protein [Cyanothece sp. SIO1E1]|nr:amidohydrolase family protein [Cyanothece sp. SIO1E1]